MRVEEFRWFASHPESYKPLRRCISLPKIAIKKVKVVQPERDIMLSPYGCESIDNFIRNKYSVPCGVSMWQALRRAAEKSDIGIEGITPKMFRKTFLSWLVVTHPEFYFIIAMSAGHTVNILQTHYAGIAFQKEDIQEMREYVKGWGSE
jgi:integrase